MRKTWLWLSLSAAMLVPHLALALAQTAVGYPQQCTNSTTNPTSAEWLTCTQARAGTSISNPIYTTPAGAAGSQTYWYTGAVWQQWMGQTAGVDNLSNSTPAPFVYNLSLGFDGTTWDRLRVSTLGDALGAAPVGLNAAAFNLYYDGTNYRRLLGGALTDNFTQPSAMPYGASFLMVWDGSKWDRMTQPTGGTSGAAGDAISATQSGLYGVSLTHFLNTTTGAFQRWGGAGTWADGMSNSTPAPLTGGILYGYNGSEWDRLRTASGVRGTGVLRVTVATDDTQVTNSTSIKTAVETLDDVVGTVGSSVPTKANLVGFSDGTNIRAFAGSQINTDGFASTMYAPWSASLLMGFNGSTWDRLYVIGTQADAQATTVNGLVTSSFLYGYNGSTFDMLRIGASNELQVTDVATRPGEDAGNDWRKVKVSSIDTSTPAKKAATAVDSAGTDIVVDAVQVIGYTNFCVYVKNLGGGGGAAFNGVQIQASPDNSSWTADLGWTNCDAAVSGTTCVYCVSGNAYNYVRVIASTASSDTTADGWITLNKG